MTPYRNGTGAGHRNIDTSAAAAFDLGPRLGPLQVSVRSAIARAGHRGRTCEELAAELELPRGTVQPRTSELQLKDLIHDSGQRRRNPSSGKRAIVWVAGAKPAADLPPLPLLVMGGADNDA